eukprot:3215310-Prymnesium_polylepis.2
MQRGLVILTIAGGINEQSGALTGQPERRLVAERSKAGKAAAVGVYRPGEFDAIPWMRGELRAALPSHDAVIDAKELYLLRLAARKLQERRRRPA